MELSDWKSYLPIYRFPPWLRNCFGCLGLLLILSGLLIFLILPSIFTYINSLDTEPIVDIQVGSFIELEEYQLDILAVENDTRCQGETICDPAGSVVVRLRDTWNDNEYVIEYMEDRAFSDAISLPLGYLIRVVSVSPDSISSPDSYRVRFQVFQPPED